MRTLDQSYLSLSREAVHLLRRASALVEEGESEKA